MPITVIPAEDQSGAIAGWQLLADALRNRAAARRQKQDSYQNLILKLSAPDTTEEQQNALLSQDPKQFEAMYGVPIEQVGKDVSTFRAAAKGVVSPTGMEMNMPEFAGNKRVLVPHPGGTAQEQQQAATLTKTAAETGQTLASTAADQQRTEFYRQSMGLSAEEAARKEAEFIGGIKTNYRTDKGAVPSMGQVQDFKRGTFDLYPTTEFSKRRELVAGIIGGDPNDPASAFMQRDMALDQDIKGADLERLNAEIGNYKSLADDRTRRRELLAKGIDPDTGLATKTFDPKELVAINTAFNTAFNSAFGGLGFPTQVTTKSPNWLGQLVPTGWGDKIPLGAAWTSAKMADNPKLAAALFGSGSADPAQIRADLLATVEPGQKVVKVQVPGVDKKGLPVMLSLTPDQAVPVIAQMRRKLATEMPGVFAAMRTVSPVVLAQIAAGNPVVLQMAKSYAPDVAEVITRMQAEVEAKRRLNLPPPSAPVDPNTAPLIEMGDKYQREIDEIRLMIQSKAVAPQRGDAAR